MGKDLIGQIVGGRFEIVRLIGRGGMGAIYEVRNTRLGRAFAMKTLVGDAADDVEVLQRFRREAESIAKIKHPNIVEVIDWDELEDGSPCIVLEYLQGEDLAHRIRSSPLGGPLPWQFIARIGDQVLSALSAAHAAGIVHRDLKPQNVFLAFDDSGEERAKLLDFGVSKIRDSHSLVTTDARLIGTPSYMAPEQAEGRHDELGPHTDLWAMGAILFEMATGDLAFDGPSMPSILYKICSKDVDDVTGRRADAPAAFAALLREALTRDRARRLADADVFRVRLREALADVANVRYSDKLAAVPVRSTPTHGASSASAPTPTRKKRMTGAHDVTVQSGRVPVERDAPTVNTPIGVEQVSTSTLDVRRRPGALIAVFAGAAAALVIAVIVVAATREHGQQAAATRVQPRPIEPAPAVTIVDAAPAPVAVSVDAAPPPAPAVKPVVVKKQAPPPVRQAEPLPPPPPPAPAPPPKHDPCGRFTKNSPEWWSCTTPEDR